MSAASDGGTARDERPGQPAPSGVSSGSSARPSRRVAARRLVTRTFSHAWDDDIFSESASAAFWQTLSLPPLLLGIFGILGYVGGWFGPDTITAVQQWIIEITGGIFSRDAVDQIIVPTVAEILGTARGEVVSIGFLMSFWSGSSAMAAFVDSITRAHGQFPLRGFVWQRTLSILMYLAGLASGILVLPIVALGPDRLLPLIPDTWEPTATVLLGRVYYPVIGLVLVLALTTLYRVALPLKPPWHRGLPGALLAAVAFLVGVTGLRAYLDWLTGTGYTYGALAAPIAFLLATFFIAFAIILGAHFNAAVQHVWPVRLRDRRGRCGDDEQDAVHDSAGEVARAVDRDPGAAAAALERLGYTVARPAPAGATGGEGRGDRPAPP